jgi:hypothetical protein
MNSPRRPQARTTQRSLRNFLDKWTSVVRISIAVSTVLLSVQTARGQAVIEIAPAASSSEKNGDDGPPIIFSADLSADEESAVTDSRGVGHIECTLEPSTLRFSWKLTYRALSSPVTSAAFHGPQTPGGEAGVLIDIGPKGLTNPSVGTVILNDGQLEYLLVGRIYVNIRTMRFPAGEIRGQLSRQRPKSPTT